MPRVHSTSSQSLSLGARFSALVSSADSGQRHDFEVAPGPAELHLSVAEIFLRSARFKRHEWDLLCVVALASEQPSGGSGLNTLYILGPDALRSRMTALPVGTLFSDLPAGPMPAEAQQLDAVLYLVPRKQRIGRVIEAIESLTTAAQRSRQSEGALALLSGVIDRLELLDHDPGVSIVFAASHSLGQISEAFHVHFRATADDQSITVTETESKAFHVRDGHLCAGPSRTTANPWRGDDFMLISVGPSRATGGPVRIDELRRQHNLVSSPANFSVAETVHGSYQEKVDRLRLVQRLAVHFGSRAAQRMPIASPIGIRVAQNLEDVVRLEGELSPEFTSSIKMMRDGLQYELGVEFPGASVDVSLDLPDDSYEFSIFDIPLLNESLNKDKLLCTMTVELLKIHGFEAEEAVNPANGNRAAWVALEHEQALKALSITTWNTSGYLILHLSSVLRKNAAIFTDIQAVAKLIRQNNASRLDDILAAPGGLPRFTSIVQGMLEDEVPIHEIATVCDLYVALAHLPTYEILEEIRASPVVNEHLFWNRDDTPLYLLGKRFTTLISEGITSYGESAVLAIEPEPTQAALRAVREEVAMLPPESKNPVLFCEDWRLRPFVRKLVELEFPYLRVISRREMTNVERRPVIATIEVGDY